MIGVINNFKFPNFCKKLEKQRGSRGPRRAQERPKNEKEKAKRRKQKGKTGLTAREGPRGQMRAQDE